MSQDKHRSSLSGASRQSAHPRLHALQKPYSRPSSFSGLSSSATMTDLANISSSLMESESPMKSPTKSSTTRPGLSSSSSYGSLPRSGSDGSLFSVSGIKSIFSRPLQWLATPTKADSLANGTGGGTKRDSFSSFGHDLENPSEEISPSKKRSEKRLRRNSPSPEKQIQISKSNNNNNNKSQLFSRTRNQNGPTTSSSSLYEPESELTKRNEIQGRAVSGFMLPPLSPNVTLKPKSHLPQHVSSQNPTNFSRPLGGAGSSSTSGIGGGLSSSKSMSYLDPPSDLLGSTSSPRKGGGMLTRSKRFELSSLVDDDNEDNGSSVDKGKGKEEEKTWSPWKSRYSTAGGAASSAANVRPTTPSRKTPSRLDSTNFTLPSVSPFKPPPSPLYRQSPQVSNAGASTSGLTRSATTANIRRAASVTSDVSMSGGLGRSGSVRGLRQSGSMLFGSVNGDRERDDERMSVDGEHKQREGSVLDWFMKDRWDGRPGSPASVAASRRLGSAGPSLSHPPIRKGQLVWHEEEKAFVRESELRAAQAPPAIHKSEAERILYTLESMRKTPLTDARKGDIPPIIGQSSRTMRKTINVPLATAAAGDSSKQRRDKDRLGGDDRVSVMISPYGRRKVADQQAREERRSKMTEERDYRHSPTPTASDARSDTQSQASDVEMDIPSSQKSHSPAPAPTPRRSSRLRRPTTAEEDAPTPKATRKSKKATSRQPETVHEDEQPQPTPRGRRTKKSTVERGTSPTPPNPSSVPTITATAPSPGGSACPSTQTVSASGYQPLADGERSRGGSSLRARSDVSKRTHVGAASFSRSATPSSGRFSAKEEDLPDMDELEQAKIPLPSFSGISFAGLNAGPTTSNAPSSTSAEESSTSTNNSSQSAGAQPSSSLGVPPPGRRPGGPLARVGLSSTRPRASSPLAGGSIVALPESPPSAPKPTKAAEPIQPPANGFFSLNGSTPTTAAVGSTTPLGKPPALASSFFSAPSTNGDSNKDKSFSFGLGQPSSAPAAAEPEKSASAGSGIPDFFGKKSAPPSGTVTPTSVPSFDFGLPKKTTEEPKAPPAQLPAATFSFGKPAESTPTLSSNGAAGTTGGFNFGAPKEAEKKDAAAPAFSFGSSSKPAEITKPAFSFGSSDKPAEPAKSTFSFGTPSTSTPAAEKPAEVAKPAFSFGTPSSGTAKPAEPAKPAFSFGAPNTATLKPAESAKPAFSFGGGSTTPAAPASTFGAATTNGPSSSSTTPASGGFTFGKPAEKKDAAPSNPFGSSTGSATAAPASTGFTFGASGNNNASTPFGNSQSNGDTAKSNPFGGASTTPAPASTGFTFGAPSSTAQTNGGTAPAFGSAAPASNPFAFGSSSAATSPAVAPASNPFGQPAQTPASPAPAAAPSFTFGQPASTPAATSNPFGQQNTSTQPAASGGFGFSFGGGGGASSTTPAPTSGGFNFGPSSTTPYTPAAGNNTFTFGQAPSTPSATQAPSSFSFGAPQSTTPAAAPPSSAGFSFGAPPGGQAQAQAPRFGSPAPADGGFSLGSADPGVPGSPGGRKVKGLPRRGAVKR